MTGRTVRRVAPSELADQTRLLLGAGFRLALVTSRHRDTDSRVIYLFLAPSTDRAVELHLLFDPRRPRIPSLRALSLPAAKFEQRLPGIAARAGQADEPAVYPGPEHLHPVPHRRGRVGGLPLLRRIPRLAPVTSPDRPRATLIGQDIGQALARSSAGSAPVAHALAYCRAVEDALHLTVTDDVRRMRAILLELERLHRHLHDLAALYAAAGGSSQATQATQIVKRLHTLNTRTTGHRLLKNSIHLAGAAMQERPDPDPLKTISDDVHQLADEAARSGIEARLTGIATLTTTQARAAGALGYIARASGAAIDARRDHPDDALTKSGLPLWDLFPAPTETLGDAAARLRQRQGEAEVSLALLDLLVPAINPGLINGWPTLDYRPPASSGAVGIGISESWHGTIVHRVEVDANLRLTDARMIKPAFFNRIAQRLVLADVDHADQPLAQTNFNIPRRARHPDLSDQPDA